MTDLTQEQANAELDKLVKEAYRALEAAETFASTHKLEFGFNPAYGMGGHYYGETPEWAVRDYGLEENGAWISSSMGC